MLYLTTFIFLCCSAQLIAQSDCSYNGTFNVQTASCDCDPGWTGPDCNQLILGAAAPNSGYRSPYTDSWGAAVLKDEQTGLYHMWVAVIENNCDIAYWARNSKVVHATSLNPEGPYQYQDEAFPVMAHEIDVKRGPNGMWIAFLTTGLDSQNQLGYSTYGSPCICDSLNQTAVSSCNYGPSTDATVVVVADDPSGPWSDPIVLLRPDTLADGIDANFTAVVHSDSSLTGLWRTYPGGSQVHWVTASNFLDVSSYSWQSDQVSLFPSPYDGYSPEGLEDMFVWYDSSRSVYHALFHDMVAQGVPYYDGLGHAFSLDGMSWTYTGEAASTSVQYSNGTTAVSARARPHLIFENGRISHLISAEQEDNNGWNYTLIEPVLANTTSTKHIQDNRADSVSLFPNPTSGLLHIKAASTVVKVELFSLNGQLCSIYNHVGKQCFDIQLNEGFYVVKVQTERGVFCQRVAVK